MKKPTLCNNTLATPTIPSSELWHYRLGHLSSKRLQILRDKFPFITIGNSNFPCDVCHYSKQKRLPYTQRWGTSLRIRIWRNNLPSRSCELLYRAWGRGWITWVFFLMLCASCIILRCAACSFGYEVTPFLFLFACMYTNIWAMHSMLIHL